MVATNLKAETLALMDKRSSMESEMNAIIGVLSQPGGPGLSGGLHDREGFPRDDIDIPTVLAQRRRLIELRNDHKDITAKIDENLQILHSGRLSKNAPLASQVIDSSTSAHGITSQESPMQVDLDVRIPFAIVDEITDASPAAEDGLQLGDQIVKFGNVEAGEEVLSRLASEIQSHEGNPIPLLITREGSITTLTLTPRLWHGRGLLGCHFRIL